MDIADLILEDHHRQRRAFAVLDDTHPDDLARLGAIWGDLAAFLETHAAAEEKVLYPEVLKLSDPDASETKDAIGDHNDIRDAIAVAQTRAAGTAGWWQAVGAARSANTEHMGEEEDDVLPAFRRRAGVELRVRLGVAFEAAKSTSSAQELDISDKDPEQYVNERT